MDDPKLYAEGNSLTHKDAIDFLTKYLHLVQWCHSNNVVLDVGCGSGDVTCEILRPRLPEGTKIIGVDKSRKMVKFCAEQYPNEKWVTLDIGAEDLLQHFQCKFDNIFSFHCLNWIKNQRQAMQNIYNLLKPGGGMFVYYVSTSIIFDAYVIVGNMNTWKQYIQDSTKYHPPYQNKANAISNLRKILDEVGFDTKICKYVKRLFTFPDRESLSKFLRGINPFYSKIPEDMKQNYIEDLIEILLNMKQVKDLNEEGSQEITFPHYNNFIYATKPLK